MGLGVFLLIWFFIGVVGVVVFFLGLGGIFLFLLCDVIIEVVGGFVFGKEKR